MNEVKILHCGDIHFDTPFGGLSRNLSDVRREELRETFSNVIKLAENEKVQLLLMAGDIFDSNIVSKMTIDFMVKKFSEIPHIKIFIAPGNHDPYNESSFYSLVKWPDNVHIFKNKLEKVIIEDLNTCVYGIGFSGSHEKNSLMEGFRVDEDKYINLMVIHGEVVRRGQNSEYNAVTEESIGESGLDYIALGHVHSFSGVIRSGKTHWAYSGCMEGRGFDEGGSKGILYGSISKDGLNIAFREMCKRKYITESVNITGCITYEDVELRIREKMGLHNADSNLNTVLSGLAGNIYKLYLTGELQENFILKTAVLEQKLEQLFFHVSIIDETVLEVNYQELEKEFSLKGIFARKVRERLSETKDENTRAAIEKALKLGLRALNNEEVHSE